jgi:hypothetical protein
MSTAPITQQQQNTNGTKPQAPSRPPHHPAVHQAPGFTAVGVLDVTRKPWIVVVEGQTMKTLDATRPDVKGTLTADPIYWPNLAGRWPIMDRADFKATRTAPTWAVMVAQVKAKLLETVVFRYPEDATLVAVWIVGTYFYRLSPSVST